MLLLFSFRSTVDERKDIGVYKYRISDSSGFAFPKFLNNTTPRVLHLYKKEAIMIL